MQSNLILTTAQAQAVYSAMCALNGSGLVVGKLMTDNDAGQRIEIEPSDAGGVRVWNSVIGRTEYHADQAAFAAAYGLPCGMAFTVAHVDHGAIVVDHVQAPSGDAALAQAQQQGLTDPVVFAGHIKAQASA